LHVINVITYTLFVDLSQAQQDIPAFIHSFMHSLIMIRPNPSLNSSSSSSSSDMTTVDQDSDCGSIRVTTTSQLLLLPRPQQQQQQQQQQQLCFSKKGTPLHSHSVDQPTKLQRHVSFDETVQVHHFDSHHSVQTGAMAVDDDDDDNSLVLPQQPCTFTVLKPQIMVVDTSSSSSLSMSSANRWETGCRARPDDRIILPHRPVVATTTITKTHPTAAAAAAVTTTTTTAAVVKHHHNLH